MKTTWRDPIYNYSQTSLTGKKFNVVQRSTPSYFVNMAVLKVCRRTLYLGLST